MGKIKIEKTKNYTVMSNNHFKEKKMSLQAKGLLSMMLSLPGDWDYTIKGLVTLSSNGESATRNALKELERFGYLKRARVYDHGKIVDIDYTLFEKPQKDLIEKHNLKCENFNVENLNEENLNEENLNEDNRAQLITNQSNTNSINNVSNQLTKEYASEQIVELVDDNTYTINRIVKYLNDRVGTNYRPKSKSTTKHIKARLNDGFTYDDFVKVIDVKCDDWLKDKKMCQYLRPETLFGSKFESYLNQPEKEKTTADMRIDMTGFDEIM